MTEHARIDEGYLMKHNDLIAEALLQPRRRNRTLEGTEPTRTSEEPQEGIAKPEQLSAHWRSVLL